jgi:ribose transport system permease protein
MEHTTTPQAKAKPDGVRRVLDVVLRSQSYFGLVLMLVLAALVSPVRNGHNIFLDPNNLFNIVRFASENGIIAIGMTLVILTAGIDLSVGAVLALCAVGAASFMMRSGFGTVTTVFLVLLIGSTAGLTNGSIIAKLGIPPFIVTLAMYSAARGIASLWAGGYAIPLAFGHVAGVAPQSFKSIFAGEVNIFGLGIPTQIFFFLAIGLLMTMILKRTAFGRHVYAVGGNNVAARLSGVNVDRVIMIVYTISGLLAGVAALLHAALVNQGSHIDGQGYELNAIAAVVIGGTSLAGGVGTVIGSMVGAVILSILDNILGLRNIPSEYQQILKGVLILVAVLIQKRRS